VNVKKLGIGTLSFALFLLAVLWSFSFYGFCMGDIVLDFLQLKSWSNGSSGIHYTIFYSILFLAPAVLIGARYPQHFLAKTVKLLQ
jgi:hypothetical protein